MFESSRSRCMTKSKGIGRGGANKIEIDLKQLQLDYLNRKPVSEIAKNLGLTIQTVYSQLKLLGITRQVSDSCKGRKSWNEGLGHGLNLWGYKRRSKDGIARFEHREVAEKILGRPLTPKEV